jgi:SAM-dependent methyltransferase
VCATPVALGGDLVWVKDGHPIVRCPSCGLLFRGDLPTDEELAAIYGNAYFQAGTHGTGGEGYPDYLADEELHRRNARRRLDLIGGVGVDGRLLDVGCAAGFFLDEASARGFDVTGVELSESMGRHAREQLGLPVVQGSFLDAELPEGPYDCITMWDYIEHSVDPGADLDRARSLLRGGGLLALSTGDSGSLVARVSGSRWHLLTPRHHNYYFDRRTLRRALEKSGFRIRRVGAPAARYTLGYVAHKLQTMSRVRLLERLAASIERSRAGRISLPVNLWDVVTVLAERDAS